MRARAAGICRASAVTPIGIAVALSCVLAATTVAAQTVQLQSFTTAPPLTVGDLLRARNGLHQRSGRLIAASGDTLRLRPPLFGPQTFVVQQRTVLERSPGRASRVRGALIGAGAGVLAAVMTGLTLSEAFDAPPAEGIALAPYLLPYTIPVGAVFGAIFPGRRWERVTLTLRP